MRTYRMTVAYDGTAYHGWQVQLGASTVQETLEAALQQIVGRPVRMTASGRTDTGVHARGQVVSFRCATRLEPNVLRSALNANTPDDIWIRQVLAAADDFHAIRDAVSKHYRYVIQDGPNRDLFTRAYSWYVPQTLDVDKMRQAAVCLIGRHDFSSFEAAGAPRKTSVRTVARLSVQRGSALAPQQPTPQQPTLPQTVVRKHELQSIVIDIEADGFLYNMVRNIVGSLVLVGKGRQEVDWMATVLQATDRQQAGPTAPALGLTLMEVRYESKGRGVRG